MGRGQLQDQYTETTLYGGRQGIKGLKISIEAAAKMHW